MTSTSIPVLHKVLDKAFSPICILATFVGIVMLGMLLYSTIVNGLPWFDWQFLTSYPSRIPERAGILPALVGSIWLLILTALIAIPIGVGTAIYMEEYAPKNVITRILQINIYNLAGVPSIVYGILGLALFVRWMTLGRCLLAGALTLSLVILPIVIIASQEAIRAVPNSLREASYALGATKWQTIRYVVLPASLSGILTSVILALSRAIGEAAPLIMIGALTFVPFLPSSIFDPFTALPIQIFNWVSRPQEEFWGLAAAGILVLLALLLTMNSIAVYIRYKKRIRW
jgi:phosphate transport system permease protein